MEASVPASEAPAAAGARAGVPPARICLHSALASRLMPRTLSMLYARHARAPDGLQRNVLAAFKRPRFKRVGMKRAKKMKTMVAAAEETLRARMAGAGGGQAPAAATLPLHSGVAAAPAQVDKLTEELQSAQHMVLKASVLEELAAKELAKVEKKHELNCRMSSARLDRWEREARSKKPPKPDLQIKRMDKDTATMHESEKSVWLHRYVAMEARAERAEAVGAADSVRIRLLKRRVSQLSKRQNSQSCARKARAEK